MDSAEHWEILRELGEGGQGKVFLVRDTRNLQPNVLCANMIDAVRKMSSSTIPTDDYRERAFDTFRRAIEQISDSRQPDNLAALKVLHSAQDARDPERAGERIRREMTGMSTVSVSIRFSRFASWRRRLL
jgi:serine/threonine protein kinase